MRSLELVALVGWLGNESAQEFEERLQTPRRRKTFDQEIHTIEQNKLLQLANRGSRTDRRCAHRHAKMQRSVRLFEV